MPFKDSFLPQLPHVQQGENNGKGRRHVYDPRPTALPERRHYTYLKLAVVIRPYAVGVGAPHFQRVLSRRNVAQRRAVFRPRVAPLAVKLLYTVSVAYEAVVRIVECREIYGGRALVCRYGDGAVFKQRSYVLFALEPYSVEDDGRPVRALFYLSGVEAHVSASHAQHYFAAVKAHGRLCFGKFGVVVPVVRAVHFYASAAAVEPVEAVLPNKPQAACAVFNHREHHALVGVKPIYAIETYAVAQQVVCVGTLEAAAHRRDIQFAGVLAGVGVEHVGGEQRCRVAAYMGRVVILYFAGRCLLG